MKEKKPFYKKWWFIVLSVLVVISIVGKLGSGNTATTNPQTAKAAETNTVANSENPEQQTAEKEYTKVDAGQMLADLESNALKAEKTYKNKNVEATGKVSVIDSSGKYIAIDGVNDEFTITGVTCNLTNDEQRDVVAEIEKGQTVVVKGEITDVGEVLGYTLKVDSIAAQ